MVDRLSGWWCAAVLTAAMGIAILSGAAVAAADPDISGSSAAGASSSDSAETSRPSTGVTRGADDTNHRAARTPSATGIERGRGRPDTDHGVDELTSDDADTVERVEPALETAAPEPLVQAFAAASDPAAPRAPPAPLEAIGAAVFDAIAGATQAFVPEPAIPAGSTVTMGRSTLEIPCGCEGTAVDAIWYFPNQDTPPAGLVYLQHGFFRNNRAMSALAVQVSERTNTVVVTPTLSSNFLTGNGCWINGEPMQQAVAALFEGDRNALTASAFAAGYDAVLPRRFVLSGHSAGGGLAVAAAADTQGNDDLAGVVMLDGVSLSDRLSTALRALPAEVQVLQIAAPPSVWNSFGSGTAALVASRPGEYVGVLLVGGTHIDSESADPLIRLIVGTPRPANVAAVPVLAAQWISTMLAGGQVTGSPLHPVPGATALPLPAPSAAAGIETLLREFVLVFERALFGG